MGGHVGRGVMWRFPGWAVFGGWLWGVSLQRCRDERQEVGDRPGAEGVSGNQTGRQLEKVTFGWGGARPGVPMEMKNLLPEGGLAGLAPFEVLIAIASSSLPKDLFQGNN